MKDGILVKDKEMLFIPILKACVIFSLDHYCIRIYMLKCQKCYIHMLVVDGYMMTSSPQLGNRLARRIKTDLYINNILIGKTFV